MADDNRTNTLVGIATGGSRALATQLFAFYIRVPIKLFRPARFDYTALLRSAAQVSNLTPYSIWTHSSPALLIKAIKQYGWRFVPDKLLPPLVANSVAGSVLYTAYLGSLTLQQHASGNEFPTVTQAMLAGWLAGIAQAAVATPIDAITMRFNSDMLTSQTSLWTYGRELLHKIGTRGAYGGFALNAFKESSSFALFFGSFELVKGPMYRAYSTWWYSPSWLHPEGRKKSRILYPTFVLMGGCIAAVTMQLFNFPLSKIQKIHTLRLQAIDQLAENSSWTAYMNSYAKTWQKVRHQVKTVAKGSWLEWLYGGSLKYMLYMTPSTSIGLLLFEILRIRYADPVIERELKP